MLKLIKCDKFRDGNGIREPIIFHPGLNTVLGDRKSSNSIGKSTLLMIIDFCFGGEDYIEKEKDTIALVKEHDIQFIFEFDGVEKCFSRSTSNHRIVKVYEDNTFTTIKHEISLETFKDGLLRYYGLNNLGLTLRDVVSRFFRIYNRQTHNELRPLNATVRQEDKLGIISLLKLYDSYTPIEEYFQAFNEAQDKKKTLENLRKYTSSLIASNKDEYEANELEIKNLEEQIRILLEENEKAVSEQVVIENEERDSLEKTRSYLKGQRRKLAKRLDDLSFDEGFDDLETVRNIEKLKHFFPNNEFAEIEAINKFHKDVKGILKRESQEDNAETLELIRILDAQIREVDEKLKNYKKTPHVSQTIIERHTSLSGRLKELREANKNFLEKEKAKKDFTTSKEELERITTTIISTIQRRINEQLKEFNSLFIREDGKKTYAPQLLINGLNSYSFATPHDTGTGTRFKSVALFDLVILNQTGLPAIAHDSIIFNAIETPILEKLFELYSQQTNKQIFMAFDDPYDRGDIIKNILLDNKVIQLSKEPNALFGNQFNLEKED